MAGDAGASSLRDLTLPEHRARVREDVERATAAVRQRGYELYGQPIRDVPEVAALLALPPDLHRSVVIDLVARRADRATTRWSFGSNPEHGFVLGRVQSAFANRSIPFTSGDALILLELTSDMLRRQAYEAIETVPQTVRAVERVVERAGPGGLQGSIASMMEALAGYHEGASAPMKYRARLAALLSADGPTSVSIVDPNMVNDGDTWGRFWKKEIQRLPASIHPLLIQLTLANAVDPPQKWKARMRTLIAEDAAQALVRRMLADVEQAHLTAPTNGLRYWFGDDGGVSVPSFQDQNVLVLRGVLWAAALSNATWAADRVATLGVLFGTSGQNDNMARDERLANTCAAALGAIDTEVAFAGLGQMKAKVTNRGVSKQIAKALDGAAARRGTSASELLELSIPTMGLGPDGRLEMRIGDQIAVLAISDDGGASLVWRSADGTERATPAKRTADGLPSEVRRAKDALRDLKKSLTMERGRVEDLFVEDRTWDLQTWRHRYLSHPLTGSMGRRLIWRVLEPDGRSVSVIADVDRLVNAVGAVVEPTPEAIVRLWHPIDASETEIAAWRTAILDREIRQPFKQAYREVYVITPAEVETETYSNRFAAHILMYGQARALMTGRRWGSNFLGPFDGGFEGTAKRDFPSHGMRAEFFHEAIDDEMGGDVTHCVTDQVRFVRTARGAGQTVVSLGDVPPIVFSEAMRDVDLFVGVTSIGADRNWQDAGEGRAGRYARLDAYFNSYTEQDLSASAAVRRDAIARLLPGLVIAERAELMDRWLVVRGQLRTYKIHIGSGNILMQPSDTYLCIVPARGRASAAGRVFLPFDDDPMLGLILSKAFLLADDRSITDTSITHQIRRG